MKSPGTLAVRAAVFAAVSFALLTPHSRAQEAQVIAASPPPGGTTTGALSDLQDQAHKAGIVEKDKDSNKDADNNQDSDKDNKK